SPRRPGGAAVRYMCGVRWAALAGGAVPVGLSVRSPRKRGPYGAAVLPVSHPGPASLPSRVRRAFVQGWPSASPDGFHRARRSASGSVAVRNGDRSPGGSGGQATLEFLRRDVLDVLQEHPHVPEGVLEDDGAVPVEHVLRRLEDL